MRKRYYYIVAVVVLMALFCCDYIFTQDKIVERVHVEEWIVPVYAVDSKGNSVPDLTKSDIELFVNDKKIIDFSFLKRDFFSDKKAGLPDRKRAGENEKIIVLVFDVALSKSFAIMRAKSIAEKLVKNAGLNTRFIVFKIESFQGLAYLGGPTKNKARLYNIIKKKVPSRSNERSVSSLVNEAESTNSKYQHEEYMFFLFEHMKYLSKKSSYFAQSFQSLYYAISNMVGTKFIYLFSEGISKAAWIRGDTHANRMAGYLLKSGAVLFFVNPTGGRGSHPESGEGFLQVLSTISGGKYLYGDTEKINSEIKNVHRAYYEIAFRSPDDRNGQLLRITVKSKRKQIMIHTIRTLEKTKKYLSLNDFEQKLMALNMVTKDSLFKLPLSSEDARITDVVVEDNTTCYQVAIPEHFRNQRVDLFKVMLPGGNVKAVITKSSVNLSSDKFEIQMGNLEDYDPYFVLVNYNLGIALVNGLMVRKIKITDVSFRENILSFRLSDYKQKKLKDKDIGLLKVIVKILNDNGQELSSDEKVISSIKNTSLLNIPIMKSLIGEYNFLIVARDLISGEEVNVTHPISIK